MKKIVVIGEILVEIMADTIGKGFDTPQPLTGPFPSGAPAIFADQAAKLGQPRGDHFRRRQRRFRPTQS